MVAVIHTHTRARNTPSPPPAHTEAPAGGVHGKEIKLPYVIYQAFLDTGPGSSALAQSSILFDRIK